MAPAFRRGHDQYMNLSRPPGSWVSHALHNLTVPSLFSLLLLFPLASLLLPPFEAVREVPGTTGITVFGALFVVVVARNRTEPHSGRAPLVLAALTAAALLTLPFAGAPWLLAASYYLVAVGLLTQPRPGGRWSCSRSWPWTPPPRCGCSENPNASLRSWVRSRCSGCWSAVCTGWSSSPASSRWPGAGWPGGPRTRNGCGSRGTCTTCSGTSSAGSYCAATRTTDAAREALARVRGTLNGYRTVSLRAELDSARLLLDGSGIELSGTGPPPEPLPGRLEWCAAWIVREGATNVLRHSGARHCRIRVESGTDGASVAVEDDGPSVRGSGTGSQAARGTEGDAREAKGWSSGWGSWGRANEWRPRAAPWPSPRTPRSSACARPCPGVLVSTGNRGESGPGPVTPDGYDRRGL